MRVLRGIKRPFGRFRRDERGGTAVQAMVIMPAILFAFVVSIVFWQTLMIRRSLHTGTHLATRYLSLYPPESIAAFDWEDIAKEFVYAELKNNPFVDTAQLNSALAPVTVTLLDGDNRCKSKFEVVAEYRITAPVGQTGGLGLPNPVIMPLREERLGEIVCD